MPVNRKVKVIHTNNISPYTKTVKGGEFQLPIAGNCQGLVYLDLDGVGRAGSYIYPFFLKKSQNY
jgi:hypothetical protein